MKNKIAKQIRKAVYGDLAPRNRKYFRDPSTGQIISNQKRRQYQNAKKQYTT